MTEDIMAEDKMAEDKPSNDNERIALSLPPNAAYVTSARLTAASIANRVGFDVDEIEDFKTAVSEACIFIIKKLEGRSEPFRIEFVVGTGQLSVVITCPVKADFSVNDQDFGIMMIKANTDSFKIESKSGVKMTLAKTHKEVVFE